MDATSLSPLHDRYRIEQALHQGRFDNVYRATDLQRNGRVAIKEMLENVFTAPMQQKKALQQFEDEYRTLSRLKHPSLPRVYDLFTQGGHWFLVMEYLEGTTLEDVVLRAPQLLTQDQVLPWVWQLLDVLSFLHAQTPAVIYRDLRPPTILLTAQGQIKLTDFGIAKMVDPARGQRTLFRAVGSEEYTPPERFGTSRSEAHTDVYALGATLYFALTGKTPPAAADRLIRHVPLLDIRRINPTVSHTVARTIERMMAVRVGDRPASMAQVKDMLMTLAEGGAPAAPVDKPVGEPRRVPVSVPAARSQRQPSSPPHTRKYLKWRKSLRRLAEKLRPHPTFPTRRTISAPVAAWLLWTFAAFVAGWTLRHP